MTKRHMHDPLVRTTALRITGDCAGRDDRCELEAIYRAVKHGHPDVAGMERGFRYVADPREVDFFTAPSRSLAMCGMGACGGDCDDHSALIAALAGTLGFQVGLRAYATKGDKDFSHVYAVVGFPKRNPQKWLGMDTTVKSAHVGWEPPPGRVKTAVLN